jgi:hypothetical protein
MTFKVNDTRRAILQGQAGVYAVASQLCLRGMNPMFPAMDDGVDIVISNGIRLQVKTSRLQHRNQFSPGNDGSRGGRIAVYRTVGRYGFGLRRGEWLPAQKKYTRVKKGYGQVADFFVLWGIDEDRFWIVPTSIKNRAIWFTALDYPNGSNNASYTDELKRQRNADYENRWDLLDVNKTVETLIESAPTETPVEKENS